MAAIIIYLLRGCGNTPPSHSDDHKTVDSLRAVINDSKGQLKVIDSLHQNNLALRKENDSLRGVDQHWKELVNDQGDFITGLIEERDALKKAKDTEGILRNCDTLAEQVSHGILLVKEYQNANDALITQSIAAMNACDREVKISDSISAIRLSAFNTVASKYDALYKDYTKAGRAKLYLGFNIGSNGSFLSAGPTAIFQTKKLRLYQAGVSYTTDSKLYYHGSVLWEIHF